MPSPSSNDDIRDLIGRYATGSLTEDERQRLFDAALDDQELFDEIAQEQDMKLLIDEPGARDRLIRALEPPKRKVGWIFALVPGAALGAILIVFWMRPTPKPQSQVAAVTTVAQPTEVAPPTPAAADRPASEPKPSPASRDIKAKAAEQPTEVAENRLTDRREAEKKETAPAEALQKEAAKDQLAATPPIASPAPAPRAKSESETLQVQAAQTVAPAQRYDQQQNAPGGPRQNSAQQKARAALPAGAAGGLVAIPRFGFHYSIEVPGHLTIIPAADGTLSVKSGDGAVLLPPQRVAVGINNDIALPDSVRSVTIVFSRGAPPPQITPAVRTAPQGDEQGQNAVAIELKINP